MKGLAVLFCAFALVACSQEGGQPEGSGESAAEVRTVTLDVQGMDCNGCVETVTKSLTGLDGVENCTVDLASSTATITAEAEATDEMIIGAVAAAGFSATKK